MSKQIDVKEADSWSEEEASFNVKYLEDRGRIQEAQAARKTLDWPDAGFPTADTHTPDPHQMLTSKTGTADPVKAGDTAPSGDGGDAATEGTAAWVRKTSVPAVVEWVEAGDSDDEVTQRAAFALNADADADAGGKNRSTLVEELEPYTEG